MTATLEKTTPVPEQPPPGHRQSGRLVRHVRQFPADYALVLILAVGAAVTRIWNFGGYPRLFTDENVYVAQGWAVQYLGRLANYTYWYDHPPFGWVQLAGWSILTNSLPRHADLTTLSGREYMVVMAIATSVLTYILARRLGMRRSFAFVAGSLWILSPLAMSFSRYVLLDNIAIAWVLAAMVLVLSPTRRLSTAIMSGICMAIAALSKETALLMWPAVVLMLVRHYWRPGAAAELKEHFANRRGNRAYAILMWLGVSTLFMGFYPLYAAVKTELFPGPDHVSLWQGQIEFQLVSRSSSGSVLQEGSDARLLAEYAWLGLDAWLPWAGVAALAIVVLMLPVRSTWRLWGPALAFGVQLVLLVARDGYLPYPYIICMLPFMALLVAGVADTFWPSRAVLHGTWLKKSVAIAGVLLVLGVAGAFVTKVATDWRYTLAYAYTTDEMSNQREALDWVEQHLPKDSRLVTEGEYWLDVYYRGFNDPRVVWVYKLDTDSAVRAEFGSVAGLDYLLLNKPTIDAAANGGYPTLQAAIEGADIVATFGPDGPNQVRVLKVNAQH